MMNLFRNFQFQIGQIPNSIHSRQPDELPSKTEVNPREHVNAINLKSGKTLEGPILDESSGEKP